MYIIHYVAVLSTIHIPLYINGLHVRVTEQHHLFTVAALFWWVGYVWDYFYWYWQAEVTVFGEVKSAESTQLNVYLLPAAHMASEQSPLDAAA